MTELLIQREANLSDIEVLNILDKAKEAVQIGSANRQLNSGFTYAVKIDSETYVVCIEKYVPVIQAINKMNLKMTEQKESATTGNSDGNKTKDYSVLHSVFLGYCEERELNIREASDLLDRLKNDLQEQLCNTNTRKEFDELGNIIKYY